MLEEGAVDVVFAAWGVRNADPREGMPERQQGKGQRIHRFPVP